MTNATNNMFGRKGCKIICSKILANYVMYKTIFVINIILHMCLQHSNTL